MSATTVDGNMFLPLKDFPFLAWIEVTTIFLPQSFITTKLLKRHQLLLMLNLINNYGLASRTKYCLDLNMSH
jgi:hypothetical protein